MSLDAISMKPKELLRKAGGIRTVAFLSIVVTLSGLLVAFLGDTLVFLFTAWFVPDPGVHHLHELAFVTMLWAVFVGLLVQLYDPEKRVAAIQQAFLVNIVITGANLLTGFFFPPGLILGGLLVAAFVLHPAGRDVLDAKPAGASSPVLFGLVALAGVPMVAYAADQYALQMSGGVHAQLGHYADMVTYVGVFLLLGVLSSVRSEGWLVPLWSAAGLAMVLGLASVQHPALPSSVGILWGWLATLWAIGFVIVGMVEYRRDG